MRLWLPTIGELSELGRNIAWPQGSATCICQAAFERHPAGKAGWLEARRVNDLMAVVGEGRRRGEMDMTVLADTALAARWPIGCPTGNSADLWRLQ
jgi:hypothetical protein